MCHLVLLCVSVSVLVCALLFPFLSLSLVLCFPSSPSRIEGPSIRGKGDREREGGEEERSWLSAREEELAHCPEESKRERAERGKQD